MKTKRLLNLLTLLLLSVSLLISDALAADEKPDISAAELPKPSAPLYLMYEAADRTATEGDDALYVIRQTDMNVLELSAEFESDSEAFYKKYGLYNFTLIMQYDSSLDNTDSWNYTSEWDTEYSAPGAEECAGIFWIGSDMMDKETVFDLYGCDPYSDKYSKMADAIIQRDVSAGDNTFNNFYFDHENHSLYIRVRYYMEWQTYDGETIGETQSKYSEWSDAAVFGKDSNSITACAPTEYEAPVISELKYIHPGEGQSIGCLTYIQSTPEQVWNAGIYYKMTEDGNFDGLETQISIDGGEWQEYNTVNAWGDWCLWNGERMACYEVPRIEESDNIKLRIRFLGTHGPSQWSNVLELNGGGTQIVTEDTTSVPLADPTHSEKDKCSLCGFCPTPLGLCIFIWLAIILILILVIILIMIIVKPKKCKNCGEKLKKSHKTCPKCGKEIK